jgi:hypothetical protein
VCGATTACCGTWTSKQPVGSDTLNFPLVHSAVMDRVARHDWELPSVPWTTGWWNLTAGRARGGRHQRSTHKALLLLVGFAGVAPSRVALQ